MDSHQTIHTIFSLYTFQMPIYIILIMQTQVPLTFSLFHKNTTITLPYYMNNICIITLDKLCVYFKNMNRMSPARAWVRVDTLLLFSCCFHNMKDINTIIILCQYLFKTFLSFDVTVTYYSISYSLYVKIKSPSFLCHLHHIQYLLTIIINIFL